MYAEARKCECGKELTGHNRSIRCKSCAARKRYIDKFGKAPERLIVKCAVCEKEFSDYKSNRKKSKLGEYFCSPECRAIWVGVHNSISRGGDGGLKGKAEKDKIYYRRKSDEIRTKRKKFYHANRDRLLQERRIEARTRKETVINHYGGCCECCGEKVIEFLTIDHINKDGADHRRLLKGKGTKVYMDIIRNNFPEDRFRVLCFNCNITRGFYGYCPHKPDEKFEYSRVPFNPGRKRTVK